MKLVNLPFGIRFKICRTAMNLSQEGAATSCKVHRITVWKWENDKIIPRARASKELIRRAFPSIGEI